MSGIWTSGAEQLHERYMSFRQILARDRWFRGLPDHDRLALITYRLELRASNPAALVSRKEIKRDGAKKSRINHTKRKRKNR
jgi:hypothetical protein